MASPAVATTNTSHDDTATTTHTISLPTGIASGDLLLAFLAIDGTVPEFTFPGGWNEFFEKEDAGQVAMGGAWRDADGLEASTISVTSVSSVKSAHCAYRITGAEDPATQAPENSASASGGGTPSINPDPDNITPTGGSADFLFIALAAMAGEATATAAPTNYSNLIQAAALGGMGPSSIHAAERQLTAASEDPGPFTTDEDDWVALTVAVHPPGAAPVVVPDLHMAPINQAA